MPHKFLYSNFNPSSHYQHLVGLLANCQVEIVSVTAHNTTQQGSWSVRFDSHL